MKKVFNDYTNQTEIHFDAKVISLGDSVQQNANGTEYVVGTVEFKDVKGNTQRASAIAYTASLAKIPLSIGDNINCRAIPPQDGRKDVLLIMGLPGGARANTDMFAFDEVSEPAELQA